MIEAVLIGPFTALETGVAKMIGRTNALVPSCRATILVLCISSSMPIVTADTGFESPHVDPMPSSVSEYFDLKCRFQGLRFHRDESTPRIDAH